MKTASPITILALLGASFAHADLVMVNETIIGEIKSKTTLYIRGDKVRTDNGTETSVIMDAKSGDMITLMHEQKMVSKVNAAELKAAAAAIPDKPLPGAIEPKITATGKKEKVMGYECEIYTMEVPGVTTKMWMTKDYPGYEKLRDGLKVLDKLGTPGAKKPEVPGLALKTETEQQGLKFITLLVSLKEQPVDESMFNVPAGYKPPGE